MMTQIESRIAGREFSSVGIFARAVIDEANLVSGESARRQWHFGFAARAAIFSEAIAISEWRSDNRASRLSIANRPSWWARISRLLGCRKPDLVVVDLPCFVSKEYPPHWIVLKEGERVLFKGMLPANLRVAGYECYG